MSPRLRLVMGPCRCRGCGLLVVWAGPLYGWRTLPEGSARVDGIATVEHRCRGRAALAAGRKEGAA